MSMQAVGPASEHGRSSMTHSDGTENQAQRLLEAIEQVGEDAWKIEVWTTMLQGLASAVPVYEPDSWSRCLAAEPLAS
jgi:hypothetical protein